MKKLDTIDYAFRETLKIHPDYADSMEGLIYYCCFDEHGINPTYFTSKNNARDYIKKVSQDDVLEFVLRETVKLYNAMSHFYYNSDTIRTKETEDEKMASLQVMFPFYEVVQKAVEIIANKNINAAIYFKSHTYELIPVITAIVDCRYLRKPEYTKYIDGVGEGETYLSRHGSIDLYEKISSDIKNIENFTNIEFNFSALNKCVSDILSGAQLKAKHSEYGLDGTLYATQDVGKRNNQEDSTLILVHPNNPNFKILAVSDGMGGADLGDQASKAIVTELANWFCELDEEYYLMPIVVKSKLNQKISDISKSLYNKYNAGTDTIVAGATLVVSVVTEKQTVISTVGDSRAYTQKDNRLYLITKDESYVWPPERKPDDMTARELNDLRFARYNNVIMRCVGDNLPKIGIQSKIIPNESYDKLLLFSDGVTDLLSQEDILVMSMQYPKEEITKMLVSKAISKNAIRHAGEDNEHYGMVEAGKDNATATMYVRR